MEDLRLISRTSRLAMWQAEFVRAELLKAHPQLTIRIIGIKTLADRWLDVPLYKMGGKSMFVKELEQALLTKEADVAVHSLKDLPAVFPSGLRLAAVCKRESPYDAWVCPKGYSFQTLPAGSRVGTSSLRRQSQLKQLRPDLHYLPLRGNVDSRVAKCLTGEWDAIVVAAAGLIRLHLHEHIKELFTPEEVLPAVGQGALGIECRAEDDFIYHLLQTLNHLPTQRCVEAERAMNYALGGNCQAAVAGFAYIQPCHQQLILTGRVGDLTQARFLEARVKGEATAAVTIGEAVAQELITQGALDILHASYER